MKKKSTLIIIMIMIFNIFLCSCNNSKNEESDFIEGYQEYKMNEAEKVVNDYIFALSKDDYEKAKGYFSNKLLEKYKEEKDKSVVVTGGIIETRSKIGDYGVLRAKITRTSKESPYCSLDTNTFKVVKQNNEYKIDEVKSENEEEVFLSNNKLRFKKNGDAHDYLLLRKNSLPKFAYSSSDKDKSVQIPVPNDNFGMLNLSYDGDILAFSAGGNNSYISLARIDQSLATVQDDTEKGSQDGGNSESDVSVEKPIGKEINSLDIIKDSKVINTMFSPDQKFIAVQYETKDKQMGIRIYDVDNFNMISYNFEESFKSEDINLTMVKFENSSFIFNASYKQNAKGIETYKELIGEWKLDLKTFKAKKIYK